MKQSILGLYFEEFEVGAEIKHALSKTIQVATENGWTVEQFLGYTSRDKAGLGWDGWRDAEIFIYEGIVLEDYKK